MAKLNRTRRQKLQEGDSINPPNTSATGIAPGSGSLDFDMYKDSLKSDKSLSERERNRRIRKASKVYKSLPNTRIVIGTNPANQTTWRWEDPSMDEERQGGVPDAEAKGPFGGKGFAGLVGGEFEDILDDMISRGSFVSDTQPEPPSTETETTPGADTETETTARTEEKVDLNKPGDTKWLPDRFYNEDGSVSVGTETPGQTNNAIQNKAAGSEGQQSSTGGDGAGERNKPTTKKDLEKRATGEDIKKEETTTGYSPSLVEVDKPQDRNTWIDDNIIDDTDIPDDYTLGYDVPSPEDEAEALDMDLDYIERLRLLSNPKLSFESNAPYIAKFPEKGEPDVFTGLTPMQRRLAYLKNKTGAEYVYSDPNGVLVGRKGNEYYTIPKSKTARGTRDAAPIRYVGDPKALMPFVEGVYPKLLQQIGKVYGDKYESIVQTQDDKILGKDKSGNWKVYQGSKGRGGDRWVDYDPTPDELKALKREYQGKSLEQQGYSFPQFDRVDNSIIPTRRAGGVLYKSGGRIQKHQWGSIISAGANLIGNFLNKNKDKSAVTGSEDGAATPPPPGQPGEMITLQLPKEYILSAIQGGQPGAEGDTQSGGFMQNMGNFIQGAGNIASSFVKEGGRLKPRYQSPAGALGDLSKMYYSNDLGRVDPQMTYLRPASPIAPQGVVAPNITLLHKAPTQLAPVQVSDKDKANYNSYLNLGKYGGEHTLDSNVHLGGDQGNNQGAGGSGQRRMIAPGLEPVLQYLFSKPQSTDIPRQPLTQYDPISERVVTGLPEDVRRRAMRGFQDQLGRYRESADPTVNLLRGLSVDKAKSDFSSSLAQEDLGERLRTEEIRRRDQQQNQELKRQTKESNLSRTYQDDVAESEADLNRRLLEQQRTGALATGLYNSVIRRKQDALGYENYITQQNYQQGLQNQLQARGRAYDNYNQSLGHYKTMSENKDLTDEQLMQKYPDLQVKYDLYKTAIEDASEYQTTESQNMIDKFYRDINYGSFAPLFNLFGKRKKANGGKLLMRKGGTTTTIRRTGTEAAANIRASAAVKTEQMRIRDREKDRRLKKKALDLNREKMIRRYNVLYFNNLRARK